MITKSINDRDRHFEWWKLCNFVVFVVVVVVIIIIIIIVVVVVVLRSYLCMCLMWALLPGSKIEGNIVGIR